MKTRKNTVHMKTSRSMRSSKMKKRNNSSSLVQYKLSVGVVNIRLPPHHPYDPPSHPGGRNKRLALHSRHNNPSSTKWSSLHLHVHPTRVESRVASNQPYLLFNPIVGSSLCEIWRVSISFNVY